MAYGQWKINIGMVPLSQRLHNERLLKKLSIEDAAAATKIKPRFLAAIERGEYNKLPSPAYAQGFVRNYASFLGLPKSEVTAFFRREFDMYRAVKVLPDSFAKRQAFSPIRIRLQQSLLILVLLFILFLGYLGFQYRSLLFAPSLSLTSPKQGSTTSQDVTIAGNADSNATVSVNNQTVPLNPDGGFTKTITLFPGKTTITIKAKNRIGRETVITRDITVK